MEKVQDVISSESLDGFLVSNFYNIFYLTSFKGLAPEEREAWVLVLKNEVFLFTDRRYNIKLKIKNKKLKIVFYEQGKNILDYIKFISEQKKITRLGFEAEDLRFSEYQKFSLNLNIEFIPCYFSIKKQRAEKTPKEIKIIKKACQITDQCLTEIKKIISPGITEKEIAFKIEVYLKNKGYDLAFYPIVAVDKNSSIPHYDTRAGEGIIKRNSIILIDFGVKYKNYCSDITRVFFLNPDAEKINVYKRLLKIYDSLIKFFKVSKPQKYKELDLYCRDLFKKERLPIYPHSLGHGIGLEIHEYPKLSFLSDEKIEKNHIFTIEPGVYLEGKWGMRIENTAVFDGEIKKLTNFEEEINKLILK